MNVSTQARNAVFAVATVLSLGFGAAQAFAAPRAAETSMTACTSYDVYYCNQSCKSRGYFGGTCAELSSGTKYCNCF
jgi:hypothetical protein